MPFRGFSPEEMNARCQGRMLDRRTGLIAAFLHAQGLSPSANILEIGSGTGLGMHLLANNFPRTSFHGVEPVAEYIAYALQHYAKTSPSIRFSQGLAEDLDLPPESFDAAYSVNVWHHIPENKLRIAAQQLASSLKPGGTYFVIEPNWLNPYIAAYQSFTADERNFLPWRELSAITTAFKETHRTHHFIFPEACRDIPDPLQHMELSLERCPLLAGSIAIAFIKR